MIDDRRLLDMTAPDPDLDGLIGDVCDLQPDDPARSDVVCVDVCTLAIIAERHLAAARERAARAMLERIGLADNPRSGDWIGEVCAHFAHAGLRTLLASSILAPVGADAAPAEVGDARPE